MKRYKCLIAAPSSGSGKTTITLGLLKLLTNRGLKVQPFKCGPDYIDGTLHKVACGTRSVNLDTYMASEAHNHKILNECFSKFDFALAEGVMGLFDGADKDKGSSAEIAKLLEMPVILIINAAATAYSVAPLIYGFKNFDKNLNLAGVIFNNVSGESHYNFLKEACVDVGVEPLGYLARNNELKLGSRHLGLKLTEEGQVSVIDKVAEQMEGTVDIPKLLKIAKFDQPKQEVTRQPVKSKKLVVAMAHDEAFNFHYVKNIEALGEIAEVRFFSPLWDSELPDSDILYFPGGYPELFAEQLEANKVMRGLIRGRLDAETPCLAECGGMMYLGQSLDLQDGNTYKMAGFFDFKSTMTDARCQLGYRELKVEGEKLIRGHEFHYSHILEDDNITTAYEVKNAKGMSVSTKVYVKKNTLASYLHLYWAERPDALLRLLNISDV